MSLQMYRCMLEGLRSKLVLGNAERMQGKTGHNMHCTTNTGMNELPIVGVIRRKLSLLCMEYTVHDAAFQTSQRPAQIHSRMFVPTNTQYNRTTYCLVCVQ